MSNPDGTTPGSFPVIVETISYVHDMLGPGASGQKVFVEEACSGDTVRNILQRFSARYPKLREALWEEGELGQHIEILFNNTILGVQYSIDSAVSPNDHIVLTGQYIGG